MRIKAGGTSFVLKERFIEDGSVYYIMESSRSDFSTADLLVLLIQEKYEVHIKEKLEDYFGESYCIIMDVKEFCISLDWHYMMGLMLRAENPESNKFATEVAYYLARELKNKGFILHDEAH